MIAQASCSPRCSAGSRTDTHRPSSVPRLVRPRLAAAPLRVQQRQRWRAMKPCAALDPDVSVAAGAPLVAMQQQQALATSASPELITRAASKPASSAAAQPQQASSTTATSSSSLPSSLSLVEAATEVDNYGVTRLAYRTDGWNYWQWRGHKIGYVQAGDSGPVIVLVHGFGASGYHWRYNIPELATSHRVYALDMLGFGWSDKPVMDYYGSDGSNVWADQIADFIREVVQADAPGERAVLAGNSLGGYNSLSAAAAHPDLVRGLVLLNGAGRFDDPEATESTDAADGTTTPITLAVADGRNATESLMSSWLNTSITAVSSAVRRVVLYITFQATKQPARVLQVLKSVYVSEQNVDDALVQSIIAPSKHPNAAAVFAKVISGQGVTVNRLLAKLDGTPVLLLWGARDPWIGVSKAALVQQLYPSADKVLLANAGHCPHDDTPAEVNAALAEWVAKLP